MKKVLRTVIFLGIGLLILSAIFWAILPSLSRAKVRSGPTCSLNLKLIQGAKEMYAEDHGMTNRVTFTKEQLLQYIGLGGKWPQCPAGGQYSIGTLHESPRCSHPKHADLKVEGN